MKHVFIAVGGSGAKVAEALVRLLAIGFPLRKENGIFTSAGSSLQIWRVDPDRSSGASASLQNCLDDYSSLQAHLSDAQAPPGIASSKWAIDIDTRLRNLDPLGLPHASATDNEIRTVRGILDSVQAEKKSSLPFLLPFYNESDLDVRIDRGFFQKPFIGAAAMAIFAESLGTDTSPGGREANLTAFDNNQTNFFLCGSLHGGTGACGVPILGKFLNGRKRAHWGWRIGACLLAPYCFPPDPPFKSLDDGESLDESMIDDLLLRHGNEPALAALKQEQEKRDLIKQILLGFYAEPDDMESRARHGLSYYRDHGAEYFDDLYLVGKPEPDKLDSWSNGGSSQINPSNSAEVVAAIAALNFFSGGDAPPVTSYKIAASNLDLDSQNMNLRELPQYHVDAPREEIEPERVFLATLILHHLITQEIPWNMRAVNWPRDIEGLRAVYKDNEERKEDDKSHYFEAARLLAKFLRSVVDPQTTKGWSGDDSTLIRRFLSPDSASEIKARIKKKLGLTKEAKEALTLGRSSIKVSAIEFGKWSPGRPQFSRGEYLRFVWSNLFARGRSID